MPEEQQKIVLHLCGCFMYVRICLEASKYTELGRFQDCFYIRSDPREDMGKKITPQNSPATNCYSRNANQ